MPSARKRQIRKLKLSDQEVLTLLKVAKDSSKSDWLILRLIVECGFKLGEVVASLRNTSKLPGIQIEDLGDDSIHIRRAHNPEPEWVYVGTDLIRRLKDFAGERRTGRLFEQVRTTERRLVSTGSDPVGTLLKRPKIYGREAKIRDWKYLTTEALRSTLSQLQARLAGFDPQIALQAQKMVPYYAVNYGLERTIRKLVSDTLREKYQDRWWEKVPLEVQKEVNKRQLEDQESPKVIRSMDRLDYTTFPELRLIIERNWKDFEAGFLHGRIEDMSVILRDLGYERILISHSCELPEEEKKRFDIRVGDWFRMVSSED